MLIGYDLSRKAYKVLTLERYPRIVSSDDVSFPAIQFPFLTSTEQDYDHICHHTERLTDIDHDDMLVPIESQPDVPSTDSVDPPVSLDTDTDEVKLSIKIADSPQLLQVPPAKPHGPASAPPVSKSAPSTTTTSSSSSADHDKEVKSKPPDTRDTRAKMAETEHRDNTRYPKRKRAPPDRYGQWVWRAIVARHRQMVGMSRISKHDRDTPRNYHEAMASPDRELWRKAIEDELSSLGLMHAWDIVTKPENAKLVQCGFIFKIKRDAEGKIIKYKARLVARGFTQREGIDFNRYETFAPVAQLASVRTVLALAAEYDMDLHQIDFTTAFLHGRLTEPILMAPPPGMRLPEGQALLLRAGLYGLRQSAYVWNQTLIAALTRLGLVQCKSDPCLFTQRSGTSVLHLAVWVDDCVIATNDASMREKLVRALKSEFRISECEELHWILGMRVTRDRSKRILRLDQSQYTRSILERFGLDGVAAKPTPSSSALFSVAPHPPDCTICNQYAEAVGALRYLTDCTRSDIAFAVNRACRHIKDPQPEHCVAVKRIFRYLAGTLYHGIVYQGSATSQLCIQAYVEDKENASAQALLRAYADADYAGDPATSRSTTGYLLTLANSPVSWKSRLQRVVSQSTMESEYLAIGDAAKDVLWLRALLAELGYAQPTTILYNDNQAAITLAHHPTKHQTTKHINVRYHFIRDLVNEKQIDVVYKKTAEMPADLLTKSTSKKVFGTLLDHLVRSVPR